MGDAAKLANMNAANATVFALIGTAMEIIPRAFPLWLSGGLPGDSRVSALWLLFMGLVQMVLAATYFVRVRVIPWLARRGSASQQHAIQAIPFSASAARGVDGREREGPFRRLFPARTRSTAAVAQQW
jgi:hypothetical protein